MVGRIRYIQGKGRLKAEQECICGVTLLTASLYEPPKQAPKKLERRLEKLEDTFRRAGVSRVILPCGFPYRERLLGLKPVEPLTLYRAVADLLALAWLRSYGISPEQGRVALAGHRLCPELEETARRLCRRVRKVRIDVPGEEGALFARLLQWECGVPVMPPGEPVHMTVSFGGAAGDLRLWGEDPCLSGLRLTAEGLSVPEELEAPLLALLWEQGSLPREKIRVLNVP